MSPIARAAIGNAPLRCGLYIRVSTADQVSDGWSLDAQRASLTNYAKSQGWKIVDVYADEGKSARKRLKYRKEIFRLLDDVKKGLIDVILFKDLTRWFRNVGDFHRCEEILSAHNVRWVAETQPGLTMDTIEGRLQVNVLLAVGQTEADNASERVQYTNKYLREQKRWNAGSRTAPRGYMVDENHRVVIDPEKEPYVRTLLDKFTRYGSLRQALLEANEEYGETFHYNNAMRLVTNPMLYGHYRGVENFVDKPYMTQEAWEAMQNLVKHNVRKNENEFFIFSGLVKCGNCGTNMAGGATRKENKKLGGLKTYMYYRCPLSGIQAKCDNKKRGSETRIEQELMEFIKEAVAARIVTVKAVHQARAKRPPRKSNRAQIEKQLDKLEDLYITSDRMTKEKYEEKRAAILAKLVEDAPEPELPDVVNLEKIQALFDSGIEEIYKDFTPQERRQFWRGILNSVTVTDGHVTAVDFIE